MTFGFRLQAPSPLLEADLQGSLVQLPDDQNPGGVSRSGEGPDLAALTLQEDQKVGQRAAGGDGVARPFHGHWRIFLRVRRQVFRAAGGRDRLRPRHTRSTGAFPDPEGP